MPKEIQLIINKLDSFFDGERAVLATVINVEGSGYRLPGARMLIAENGDTFGTVSGGCLEADVLERARRILDSGKPEIMIYDTTAAAEDSIFSLNMGCNGIVSILIEPVEKDKNLFQAWRAAIGKRERQMIATLIAGKPDLRVGGRIRYGGAGLFSFEGLPERIEKSEKLIKRCREFFDGGEPASIIESEEDGAQFFFENIDPPLNLYIFGAGHDAIPLASFAGDLGWRVTVIDHRAAFATAKRFPGADEIIIARPEDYHQKVRPDQFSAAVVMNHNYEKDRETIRFLLGFELNYLGALGPKRRTEKMIGELRAAGVPADVSRLENLYAPVGLDIGGDTPELIALAIAGEIKSVLAKRKGGPLRERQGSIYDR